MPAMSLDTRNKKVIMALGIAFTLIALFAGRLATPIADAFGLNATMLRPVLRSVVSVVLFLVLGGASWLKFNLQKIRDTWHYARLFVIVNIIFATIFGALSVFFLLVVGEATSSQLSNFLFVTVLCIFVGINEETMFRGLMFGGLLAGIGDKKKGAMWAALISSFAFGLVHVVFDINFTNGLDIVQGLLKTLQTGMFAVVLCVSVLEGRNLIGAMTVHGFFDWIVLVATAFNGRMPTGTYVSKTPQQAFVLIAVFGFFCVIYLPKTIKAVKRLSEMQLPQYGPFVPARESVQLANTAWEGRHSGKVSSQEKRPKRSREARIYHVLNNKVATILVTFVCFVMTNNITSLIAYLIFDTGTMAQVFSSLASVVVSLAFLVLYQRFFAGRFDGVVAWSKTGMLMVLPALLMVLINLLDWVGATFNNPLVCLLLALTPGFVEEIIFRAIPLSNWVRVSGEKRDILEGAVISSAIFAVIHMVNLIAGATFSATVFQVFYAFCLGTVFAAVLLRTGSIWPCIIMHTLIDFTAYMVEDMNDLGVLTTELQFDASFWCALVASIALVGWAAYLLRPAKQQEVVNLWKRKWSKA